MLWFPSWLGNDLEAMLRDRLDRCLWISKGVRLFVVVLLLVFDPDRRSAGLDDLGHLDLGRLLLACHRDLVALLEIDLLDGLGPDVSEMLGTLAFDDKSMSENCGHRSRDRDVLMFWHVGCP